MSLLSRNSYARGQSLRHHGGSLWEVERMRAGDYVIRCIVGTKRPGWIGGEESGTRRIVHPDYLHGDGWRAVATERSEEGNTDG